MLWMPHAYARRSIFNGLDSWLLLDRKKKNLGSTPLDHVPDLRPRSPSLRGQAGNLYRLHPLLCVHGKVICPYVPYHVTGQVTIPEAPLRLLGKSARAGRIYFISLAEMK